MLKNKSEAGGFQHFQRDLGNVNEDKTFFSDCASTVFQAPSVIMCSSLIHEAKRAVTHLYMRALQTCLHGKECYIVVVIYLPYGTLTE